MTVDYCNESPCTHRDLVPVFTEKFVGLNFDDPTRSITDWPRERPCVRCGARAVHLSSSWEWASFECRGTPTPEHDAEVGYRSAYGPDGCGHVFNIRRVE